jgi:hypothetical protein
MFQTVLGVSMAVVATCMLSANLAENGAGTYEMMHCKFQNKFMTEKTNGTYSETDL